MNVWFVPFQISACYQDFANATTRNNESSSKARATICLTGHHKKMSSLRSPQTIAQVGPYETLYIEGHGKVGSDLMYESDDTGLLKGPTNEYMDAYRLARTLKSFGFRGGHIRLHVCHSAEPNGFGHHLRKAMRAYGIPFRSMKGRIGKARAEDGTGGTWAEFQKTKVTT